MAQQSQIRGGMDRLRHTILFEVFLVLSLLPVGKLIFHADAATLGATALVLSLIAMGWNALFNYLFDNYLLKTTGAATKSGSQRIAHALLFEAGLLLVTIPILALALQISLWHAFMADIGFVVFALLYAYVYNLAYDKVFPLPAAV